MLFPRNAAIRVNCVLQKGTLEYCHIFGDAIAQEIIIELARLHWLLVIARGSSFQFRDDAEDGASKAMQLSPIDPLS